MNEESKEKKAWGERVKERKGGGEIGKGWRRTIRKRNWVRVKATSS